MAAGQSPANGVVGAAGASLASRYPHVYVVCIGICVRMASSEQVSTTDDVVDVDELLDDLSLSEKVGQMVGTFVGAMDYEVSPEDAKEMIREYGVGSVAAFGIGVSWHHDPEAVAELSNELQRVAVEETDHGIPVLLPVDAIHGNAYVNEAAVYPHGLGMAATRNEPLVERSGEITGLEIRASGARINYGPNCDLVRDPRWGRTFETFGESPLLCGDLGAALIRGQTDPPEGEGVAATAKHFPAYGDPEGGEDTGVVDRSPSTVHHTFVPPFEKALDAGARIVMPCYNSIDGLPVHGSERYLTELLRERMGFDGPVLSDWGGVDMLHEKHKTARDQRDSARQAVQAGLDQVSIGGPDYAEHIQSLVEDGELSEERVDEAVRRILELKREVGLFDDPYVDVDRASEVVGREEHREHALEAARQAQTLLQNEGDLLPLDPDVESVLVTGPNADDLKHQMGGWGVDEVEETSGTTVLEGVESVVGDDTEVRYEQGATVRETEDLDAVRAAAEDSDVAVAVLGENWYFHEFGPQDIAGETGTWPTRTDLELSDAQQELLRTVHETGTPTVLVTITGRPLAINWAADNVPAILQSYYPGNEGGRAVAETLFGEHNPAGKLPISVPKSAAHLPTRFNYLRHPTPIGDDEHPDSYDPLFEFGHGLSYTDFEVRDLALSDAEIGPGESVTATVEVENVGERAGAKAIDAFLSDAVSSRVRPVKEHVGYDRVELAPGESATVEIEVPNRALAVTDSEGRKTVEPGRFDLEVEGLEAAFEVTSQY